MFNPTGGYGNFILPGVLALILQQTLLLGIGMLYATRNERRQPFAPACGTAVGHAFGWFRLMTGRTLCFLLLAALVVISLLRPQTPQGEFLQPDGNEVSPTLPLPAADPAAASEAN